MGQDRASQPSGDVVGPGVMAGHGGGTARPYGVTMRPGVMVGGRQ